MPHPKVAVVAFGHHRVNYSTTPPTLARSFTAPKRLKLLFDFFLLLVLLPTPLDYGSCTDGRLQFGVWNARNMDEWWHTIPTYLAQLYDDLPARMDGNQQRAKEKGQRKKWEENFHTISFGWHFPLEHCLCTALLLHHFRKSHNQPTAHHTRRETRPPRAGQEISLRRWKLSRH